MIHKSVLLLLSGICGIAVVCACANNKAETTRQKEDTAVSVSLEKTNQEEKQEVKEKALIPAPVSENVVSEKIDPKTDLTLLEEFVYLTAPEGRGDAYCPARSNSLAWNGLEFECCGRNMKSVVIPSRLDSICCPVASTQARWVGAKWNDYECCPEGTVETKNTGTGDKYVCCPQGYKALNGECLSLK